jgi:hypothetical protein
MSPARVVMQLPPVTSATALDDAVWFQRRPARRFRGRPGDGGSWIIRRRGTVLFRTWTPQPVNLVDTDKALATHWFETAWPGELVNKSMKRGRKAAAGGR